MHSRVEKEAGTSERPGVAEQLPAVRFERERPGCFRGGPEPNCGDETTTPKVAPRPNESKSKRWPGPVCRAAAAAKAAAAAAAAVCSARHRNRGPGRPGPTASVEAAALGRVGQQPTEPLPAGSDSEGGTPNNGPPWVARDGRDRCLASPQPPPPVPRHILGCGPTRPRPARPGPARPAPAQTVPARPAPQ